MRVCRRHTPRNTRCRHRPTLPLKIRQYRALIPVCTTQVPISCLHSDGQAPGRTPCQCAPPLGGLDLLAFWGWLRGWLRDRLGFLTFGNKPVIQNVFCKIQVVLEDTPSTLCRGTQNSDGRKRIVLVPLVRDRKPGSEKRIVHDYKRVPTMHARIQEHMQLQLRHTLKPKLTAPAVCTRLQTTFSEC